MSGTVASLPRLLAAFFILLELVPNACAVFTHSSVGKDCQDTHCGWTRQWSCPDQSPGTKGVATYDESIEYQCCCAQHRWKQDLDEAPVRQAKRRRVRDAWAKAEVEKALALRATSDQADRARATRLAEGRGGVARQNHYNRGALTKRTKKAESLDVPGSFPEWQSWSELIFLRKHGFVFCALPKSGCTSWKQLLLRIRGSPHWKTKDSTFIHDPVKSGLDLVGVKPGGHSRNKASHNITDIAELLKRGDTVTRAVIVRDPVTRLLSTFLDRCVENREWNRCGSKHAVNFTQTIANLEVKMATEEGVRDIHSRRQTDMCGMRYMDYDLVGHMENYYEDSRTILERVGLWEDFGKSGWGPDGKHPFGVQVESTSNHKKAKHLTEDLICRHYSPDLLGRVYELYKPDFEAFGYRIDPWLVKCAPLWEEMMKNELLQKKRSERSSLLSKTRSFLS